MRALLRRLLSQNKTERLTCLNLPLFDTKNLSKRKPQRNIELFFRFSNMPANCGCLFVYSQCRSPVILLTVSKDSRRRGNTVYCKRPSVVLLSLHTAESAESFIVNLSSTYRLVIVLMNNEINKRYTKYS